MATYFEWLPVCDSGGDAAAAKPSMRWAQSATLLDDSILFIGGAERFGGGLAESWAFSERAGWSKVAATNSPILAAHTANLVQNHIYCFGGDGRDNSTDTWVLDLDSMNWSVLEVTGRPPRWRRTAASTIVDEFIYIFGGWGVGGPMNDCHVLESKQKCGHWRRLHFGATEEIPSQRGSHSVTSIGHPGQEIIVVYGGYDGSQLNDLWVLDVSLSPPTWHRPMAIGSSPPGGRSGHSATAVGCHLVVLGGEKELQSTFYHDVYVLDCEEWQWEVAHVTGNTPIPRGWHSATLLTESGSESSSSGSRIFVFGGGTYRSFFNDSHILDLAAGGSAPLPADSLAADLGSFLKQQILTDVSFTCKGGETVHAHSQILCARSPFFAAILEDRSRWSEGTQAAIPVDVPADSFRIFLEFLYTGRCSFKSISDESFRPDSSPICPSGDESGNQFDVDVRRALDLLPLASMHMMPRLQAQCANILGRAVKQSAPGFEAGSPALPELLKMAELHNLTILSRLVRGRCETEC